MQVGEGVSLFCITDQRKNTMFHQAHQHIK